MSELLAWAATMDAVIWSPGAPLTTNPAIEIDELQRVAPAVVSPPSRRSGSPDRIPARRDRVHAAGAVGWTRARSCAWPP